MGIEIDPTYFAIAQKRIEQAAMQPSLFDTMSRTCHSTQAPPRGFPRAGTLFSMSELEPVP